MGGKDAWPIRAAPFMPRRHSVCVRALSRGCKRARGKARGARIADDATTCSSLRQLSPRFILHLRSAIRSQRKRSRIRSLFLLLSRVWRAQRQCLCPSARRRRQLTVVLRDCDRGGDWIGDQLALGTWRSTVIHSQRNRSRFRIRRLILLLPRVWRAQRQCLCPSARRRRQLTVVLRNCDRGGDSIGDQLGLATWPWLRSPSLSRVSASMLGRHLGTLWLVGCHVLVLCPWGGEGSLGEMLVLLSFGNRTGAMASTATTTMYRLNGGSAFGCLA